MISQRLLLKLLISYVGGYFLDDSELEKNYYNSLAWKLEGALFFVCFQVNPRWEVAVCNSEKGFQQISFVNSISTIKGGSHVNVVVDQMVEKLIAQVNRKNKDKKQVIKNFQVG